MIRMSLGKVSVGIAVGLRLIKIRVRVGLGYTFLGVQEKLHMDQT